MNGHAIGPAKSQLNEPLMNFENKNVFPRLVMVFTIENYSLKCGCSSNLFFTS